MVVSFDKINELMNEKRQTARAEVEKEEAAKEPEEKTQEEPPAAGDDEPKKARRGRPPKEEKAEPTVKEAAKPRKGRPPKADKAAPARPRRLSETNCPEVGKRLRRLKLPRNPKRPHPKMRLRSRNRLHLSQPLRPSCGGRKAGLSETFRNASVPHSAPTRLRCGTTPKCRKR